jgi:hypothetical protein
MSWGCCDVNVTKATADAQRQNARVSRAVRMGKTDVISHPAFSKVEVFLVSPKTSNLINSASD